MFGFLLPFWKIRLLVTRVVAGFALGLWELPRCGDFGGLQRCCRMEAVRPTEPGQSLSCSPAEWDVRRSLCSFSPLVQWEDNFLAGKSRPSLARVFIVTGAPGMWGREQAQPPQSRQSRRHLLAHAHPGPWQPSPGRAQGSAKSHNICGSLAKCSSVPPPPPPPPLRGHSQGCGVPWCRRPVVPGAPAPPPSHICSLPANEFH